MLRSVSLVDVVTALKDLGGEAQSTEIKDAVEKNFGGIPRNYKNATSFRETIQVIIQEHCPQENKYKKKPFFEKIDRGRFRLRQTQFADQFSIEEKEPIEGRRRDRTGTEPVRNPDVRQRALNRAQGKCEYCGAKGFSTVGGLIYLESHHIIPLSDGGADIDGNVAALCPNHHRQAHHGINKDEIRETLQSRITLVSA